jgi:hypothetical protein
MKSNASTWIQGSEAVSNNHLLPMLFGAFISIVAFSAFGVETKVFRDDTFTDFYRGETTGTEILAEGKITIGPLPKRLARTDDAIAWKVALDRYDDNLFVATGHEGKVWRVQPDGKTELWADLPEVEATAIVVDFTGGVLVGASPSGKIYRVVQAGKPELYFDTKEQQIWDLIFDRDGVLYAATGPHGKIFRIRGPNNGEVYCDTPATNVMALGFMSTGSLLAATQGKAYVLEIPKAHSLHVRYAASDDECRGLAVDASGNIFVAVNSARLASVLDRLRTETQAPQGASPPQAPGQPQPSATARADALREALASMTSSLAGLGGQSQVVKIEPTGFASTFWTAPEAPIHAIVADPEGKGIYVAAGSHGKIYRLLGDTNYSLVADVEEQCALSFTSHHKTIYFTTADRAAVYALGERVTTSGLYASRPIDAGTIVVWGNIMSEAEVPQGSRISLDTRTGNTPDPFDKTWSAWQKATPAGDSLWKTGMPVAQYLQYRLRLEAAPDGALPSVDALQFFYVQRNASPVLKSIRVEKIGGEATPPSSQPQPSSTPTAGATGTPGRPDLQTGSRPSISSGGLNALLAAMASSRPDAPTSPSGQPPATALGAPTNSNKFSVSWDASDPNGDKLIYRVALKADDETEWQTLEKEYTNTRYVLDASLFPDGRYQIQVVASDRQQNPEDVASSATIVSRTFTIDNTPPDVPQLAAKKLGANRWEIRAQAGDALSILASASYCLDSESTWYALLPEDGIFDSEKETFCFEVEPKEKATEHLLRLRVVDREGNARVAKLIIK